MPNVSLCKQENEVHYNPYVPPFFAKLTLNNGEVVELEGSGELTGAMTSSYKSTLVSAEIGTLCTSVGDNAFTSCSDLTSITIPNSITSIGNYTFASCSDLTSITIPNSITNIGQSAFEACTSLTSCTIGSGVTSIGGRAFYNCSNLTIIISRIMSAPSVGGGTFFGVSNGGTLYVPIGSSGYETWMNNQGNLGMYNWTKVEQ